MARLTEATLLRDLERGKLGGVFFFHGPENLLKERLAARVAELHLDAATRDFNFDQLRGAELEVESLASVLQTPPMMAEWRVVVVRDAQHLAAAARSRSVLESLADRPPAQTAVILLAEIPSGSKAQVYEKLKRDARSVEFAALSEEAAPDWVIQQTSAAEREIELSAARALVAAVGSDAGLLTREIEKLMSFAGGTITIRDVEAAVGFVPRQNRWEWLDRVAEGKLAEARTALPSLLDAGESGVGLVIALGSQFLRLAVAVHGGRSALERHLPRQQAWLANRILAQSRNWTARSVERALDELLRADRLLKSVPLTPQQILEELLLRLDAARRAGAAA